MDVVDLFKILAHDTRIRILDFLVQGPGEWHSVLDLEVRWIQGVRRSVLSHHLGLMRDGGLLDRKVSGQFRLYRVSELGRRIQIMVKRFRRFTEVLEEEEKDKW